MRAWTCAALALLLCRVALDAQSLTQIRDSGRRDNRINLVIFAEGYTAAELTTKFPQDARALADAFIGAEPYREYQDYFNVFTIAVASAQSGSDHPARHIFVNTYFNSSFDSFGTARLITIPPNEFDSSYADGQGKVDALLADLLPDYDLAVMSVNDPEYGGSGGAVPIVSTNESAPEIAIHETAHTLAALADEYDTPAPVPGYEAPNTTQQTNRNLIKWRNWIRASTPIPTPETLAYAMLVGLFEGANYNATGWYRPKLNCRMNTLGNPFCEVCVEALTINLYKRLALADRFSPANSELMLGGEETLYFNVIPLPPRTYSLSVQWLLDDTPIGGATKRAFSIAAAELTQGPHTVSAVVSDPTTFVRTDPANTLRQTTTWKLDVAATPGAGAAPVLNLSTRARVETGEKITIGGFILTGPGPKRVIVRAIGPSLRRAGIAGVLDDPMLVLEDAAQNVVGTNDNWRIGNEAEIQATTIAPQDDLESAIVATLQPGAYTALVEGKGAATGVALVEVYDLQPDSAARLANISTRASVGTGDAVMIGGFIVGAANSGRINVVVRATGPSLAKAGIADPLLDPTLQLLDANGEVVIANDDWKDSQQADLETSGLKPSDDRESAAIATLPAAPYTVVMAGKNGTRGVGLIEIYQAHQ